MTAMNQLTSMPADQMLEHVLNNRKLVDSWTPADTDREFSALLSLQPTLDQKTWQRAILMAAIMGQQVYHEWADGSRKL